MWKSFGYFSSRAQIQQHWTMMVRRHPRIYQQERIIILFSHCHNMKVEVKFPIVHCKSYLRCDVAGNNANTTSILVLFRDVDQELK
jgi:hypothetical protein